MRYQMASAAALALLVPAIATAGTPGFVDVSLGVFEIDSEGDFTSFGAGGSVVTPLAGNWHVQFDGEVVRFESGGAAASTSGLSAHVFHDGGDWAVGAQLDYHNLVGTSIWTLGAEAQYTAGAFVLEAGLGIVSAESAGTNDDAWNGSAAATWFANPDLAFTGRINYLDQANNSPSEITDYGLDAEYRFAGTPYSVIGSYAFTDTSTGIEADTWSIGLRYGFGDGTLQQRRNEGPRWLREKNSLIPL
jgi:hypothetical protein